jgi:hypothetical protein
MPPVRYTAHTMLVAVIAVSFVLIALGCVAWRLWPVHEISYGGASMIGTSTAATSTASEASTTPVFVATHVASPSEVRAVYFTSWSAGTPSFQKEMFSLVQGTRVNSVVIDVKDYSGRISFSMNDPLIQTIGSVQERIPDIEGMIAKLHEEGIYVIGRVAVFQDPYIVTVHPEWAVRNKDTGGVWRDAGGAYWVDPDNQGMWKYISTIATQAYAAGFDEINFDYVRFPSDGVSTAVFDKSASTTKEDVITSFFSYLHDTLSPRGIPISADIFGQTTSDPGDMGIGQHFENVLPYFDYVDPMVYPSHYIDGFIGYAKPAQHPYQIVKYALDQAVARADAASSSPSKIRPWLQAFDLGAIYTPMMVHEQMEATADAGANGWLLWNAGAIYDRDFVMPFDLGTTTASAR